MYLRLRIWLLRKRKSYYKYLYSLTLHKICATQVYSLTIIELIML